MPTLTFTAQVMHTYRVGNYWQADVLKTGHYGGSAGFTHQGFFWFSAANLATLRSALNNAVIDSVRIYCARENSSHGSSAATSVQFNTSTKTAWDDASAIGRANGYVGGTLLRGEGKWFSVPVSYANHLKTYNSFCIYHDSVNTSLDYSYYILFTGLPKIEVTYHYTESTGTLSAGSVDAGSAVTLNISAWDSAYTHKAIWSMGSYAPSTVNVAAGAASTAFTVPLAWLTTIPSATSGVAQVKLETYSGSTLLGSKTYSFTVRAGASIVPTLSGITAARVDGTVPPAWALYVQGKSKATLSITGAAGAYGSTVTGYSITGGGFSGSSSSLTTGFLPDAGTITFTGTITDSRGRTASKTVSITVVAYAPPQVVNPVIFRSAAGGTASDSGTYISVKGTFQFSSVSAKNTITAVAYYKQSSAATWTTGPALASNVASVTGGGTISTASSYDVRITLTDAFGSVNYLGAVPTAGRILSILSGGSGMAVGKVAETALAFEVAPAWNLIAAKLNGKALTAAVLLASEYTAADVLAKLKTVDGAGSGLDADLFKGAAVIPLANGGTGATTAALARNALGLGNTAGALPIANGGTGTTTAALARNALGLGNTTGALPVANGGTASTTAAAARVALGIVSGTGSASASTSTISYGVTFTAVPQVFAVWSTTGAIVSGAWGALKIHTKTTTGFSVAAGGSLPSTAQPIDWVAIGPR